MRIRAKINNEMEFLELQLQERQRDLIMIQRLVPLHSVGSFIDPVTGLVCPMLANGDPEMDPEMATHIHDIADGWLSTLDKRDTLTVGEIQGELR